MKILKYSGQALIIFSDLDTDIHRFFNQKSASHILKSVDTIIPPTNSTGHKKYHHAFADALYPKLSDLQE
jgi:hypothetical protein